jgi:hypothetical protein
MSAPTWLDKAAGFATCNILATAGSALVGSGVATLAAGGSGVVPLTLGGLSLLAAGAACQPTAVNEGNPSSGQINGCEEIEDGGYGQAQYRLPGGDWANCTGDPIYTRTVRIGLNGVNQQSSDLRWRPFAEFYSATDGTTFGVPQTYATEAEARQVEFRIDPVVGDCKTDGPPIVYPPNIYDPIPYTDPDTNCTYNVTFQGFAADVPGGSPSPVFKIEAAPQVLRNSGGIVGGCNFEPVIYQQPPGGGGPPRIGPWDPSWTDWDGTGTPPWLDFLSNLAGGIISNIITQYIFNSFAKPLPPYQYTMRAACNYKQDGSFETYTITLPEQPWETRVLAMQEMNIDFLQQHLLWKTPTCSGGGQPISGDPVTINWISDEASPASGTRLNKIFTYFDQNNTTLADTVAHWKDFTWQSGPVVVSCVGTELGKPQVWAASVDEAKRVIQHAALVAGVDLTAAEWITGAPRSARNGVPATMRVLSRRGVLGITKRDGPNGYPEGILG